jgi:hypothetical protein
LEQLWLAWSPPVFYWFLRWIRKYSSIPQFNIAQIAPIRDRDPLSLLLRLNFAGYFLTEYLDPCIPPGGFQPSWDRYYKRVGELYRYSGLEKPLPLARVFGAVFYLPTIKQGFHSDSRLTFFKMRSLLQSGSGATAPRRAQKKPEGLPKSPEPAPPGAPPFVQRAQPENLKRTGAQPCRISLVEPGKKEKRPKLADANSEGREVDHGVNFVESSNHVDVVNESDEDTSGDDELSLHQILQLERSKKLKAGKQARLNKAKELFQVQAELIENAIKEAASTSAK